MIRPSPRRGRGEDGASLLIPLAFLLVFAVLDAHDNAIAATGSCSPSPAKLPSFDAVKTYCNATDTTNTPQYNDGADPAYTSRFTEILIKGGTQLPSPNPTPSCHGNTTEF